MNLLWLTARAGGIVAWTLAAASVLWGLALSTRILGRSPRPNWLYDLHRFLGGLALVFTGVHVVAISLDTYTSFGLVQVLVPFAATWHPGAVAWGIVGLYLLVAVEVTSLLRGRIPARLWRRVHSASFALFAVATIHALTGGTDRHAPAFVGLVVGVTALVAAVAATRVFLALDEPSPGRAGPQRAGAAPVAVRVPPPPVEVAAAAARPAAGRRSAHLPPAPGRR
jgi:predicted ferric reductase